MYGIRIKTNQLRNWLEVLAKHEYVTDPRGYSVANHDIQFMRAELARILTSLPSEEMDA